ncbi:uncharacterized protein LOC135213107 [Macrobrachium nipponense]|uniref:uncharacterized protein LOC135213107 n=1 Tax=Macrobrachium nipponense TaxID=159736 RepID=UPI0030C82E93
MFFKHRLCVILLWGVAVIALFCTYQTFYRRKPSYNENEFPVRERRLETQRGETLQEEEEVHKGETILNSTLYRRSHNENKTPVSERRLETPKEEASQEEETLHKREASQKHPALSKDCYVYKDAIARNTCCRMHDYMADPSRLLTCLRRDLEEAKRTRSAGFSREGGGRWIIAGDSRLRFFFFGIIRRLAGPRLLYRYTKGNGKKWRSVDHLLQQKAPYIFREDMEIKHLDAPEMRVVFYWDARLQRLAKDLHWWLKYDSRRPVRLIISTGTHYMCNSKDVFKKEGRAAASGKFRKFLSRTWNKLYSLGKMIPLTFHFIDYFQEKRVYPELQHVWHNENVDYYNSVLKSKLSSSSSSLIPWDSNVPLSGAYHNKCSADPRVSDDLAWRCNDPVHMGFMVIDQYWNMFLNDACNRYFSFGEDYC